MKKRLLMAVAGLSGLGWAAWGETVEPIKYGDMNSWVTRNIKESRLLGGDTRQVYAIGPEQTINGDEAYTPLGGSPWGSSNVMANVVGIVKTSNAVFPEQRTDNDRACRMSTIIESCKVIGMINIKVLVSGSIFLGQMMEPIRSTSNPYSKMEMGIPFTKRPKALQLDYKMVNPGTGILTYCNGSKPKESKGEDEAEVFIILQRRWEDKDGNLYAKRVGTGRERFSKSTDGWVNKHRIPVQYGDITSTPGYKSYMGLIPEDRCYYARNSKGKMVPVHEVGWDDANATPTHMMMMASSGAGTAYVGTVGMDLCVDNIALVY